ncbi:MAG: uracil-DNA glycosylase [Bifidobacterium sp.]|nr:uracil-DNA glycosylase [Bifidobacterium sp.]
MNESTPNDDFRAGIDPGWARALEPVAGQVERLMAQVRDEQARGITVLPSYDRILRAFTIPFDSIHVLIMGQDPYPTPGNPVGLSFSVAPGVTPLPKSLVNIYRELQDDLHVPPPRTGDLTPWTRQGVMLLNRCLTVRAGQPGSHENRGWEAVTDQAIHALDERTDIQGRPVPLVAILWGRKAQQLARLLPHAAIIASPHPSPLSASRGFFGSKPFSRANEALERMGARPVDWSL